MEECVGVERVKNGRLTPLVDDERLQDASCGGVAGYFEDYQEHGMVPSRHGLSMYLAIEHAAMMSVLDPREDQEPWVLISDVHFDFLGMEAELAGDQHEYLGYLEVAISSLVPDLYPYVGRATP